MEKGKAMREKLIELLQCSPTDIMGNHGVGALADHLIANGVTLDNQVSSSKWIPVSERLPGKHGKPYVCLLTFPHGGQFPYILNWYEYGDNGYVNGRHFQDEGLDGMKVTHWMPLPQPPKEGE